ncbi:glycogen debranching N-terminal domain-containing protein, partial [Dactylosporangium sp. NPDC049140]|uniref:glycogen debranching N-terminal domain-containing protein n=1 Tax=Dactylosporangium sp. NPDC049140 TaxID=3155647 RepID=UPI0034081F8D
MRQPYLHEHVTCVAAPATWLSGPSGELGADPDGLYVADRRVLARLAVTVAGHAPVPIGVRRTGASTAEFTAVVRELGDDGPDPTVTLTRRRAADPSGGTETLVLTNASHTTLRVAVEVRAATDFARMGAVKDGRTGGLTTTELTSSTTSADGMTATVVTDPAPTGPGLRWEVTLAPHQSWTASLTFTRGLATERPDGLATERPDGLATERPDGLATDRPGGQATTQRPDGLVTPRPESPATEGPGGQATTGRQHGLTSALHDSDPEVTPRPGGPAPEGPSGQATQPPDRLATNQPDSLAADQPDSLAADRPDSLDADRPGGLATSRPGG